MPLITIVVLVIFLGSTLAIVALGIFKSIASKKDSPTVKPAISTKKEPVLVNDSDEFEEIAAIIAAIEAYSNTSSSFSIRRIIRKEDGSVLWSKAGTNQNLNATI